MLANWSLAAGRWFLVAGFWVLVACFWYLVTGGWSIGTCLLPLVAGLWLPVTGHLFLVAGIRCGLRVTGRGSRLEVRGLNILLFSLQPPISYPIPYTLHLRPCVLFTCSYGRLPLYLPLIVAQ